MRIVLCGGGSGGHFYPLMAVAEAIQNEVRKRRLLEPELYYLAPEPYDERALFERGVRFKKVRAGKLRRYFSLQNFTDSIVMAFGFLDAFTTLYALYPDVVFSKGSGPSFPVVLAARLLNIPIVIHESDASVGRANLWAGKFAKYIGVSYDEAADAFPGKNVALVGNPVRREIRIPDREGGREFFNLEAAVPVILIFGGSQGAQTINSVILDALPRLVDKYEVIHQTGTAHIDEVTSTAKVVLGQNPNEHRYHPMAFLSPLALRMAAGAASVAVSRAGSGSIYELAIWGIPAILIPIPEEWSHDQKKNAYSYARGGGAVVLEEKNLAANILLSEIERIVTDPQVKARMTLGATAFAKPDAAEKLASVVLSIALEHE